MRAPSGESSWVNEQTRLLRQTVVQFIQRQLLPHKDRWIEQGYPDREAWVKAGSLGLLLADVAEKYGGGGGSFAHEAVLIEELSRAGIHIGFNVHNIVAHYIAAYAKEEQKRRWLPGMAAGQLLGALAITEAEAGSDIQAIRTTARKAHDRYVVNGSKTFITNGWQADLVCLAVRTGAESAGVRGISLLVLETADLAGYRKGRPLRKMGRHTQDVCELFFDDVEVPAENVLGGEGRGLFQIMDQLGYERLSVGLSAIAAAERAIELTVAYAKERRLFGKTLIDLQNARFKLAECKTEAQIGRVFIDNCIQQILAGRLDPVTAAMAKYWLTDRQARIMDECVQLHGGYGYMEEYPISHLWVDSRIERIYAGSNETLKEMIGRAL